MTMRSSSSKSWFERHAKTTLFFLILLSTLLIDLLGTAAYHLIKYGSISKTSSNPIVGQRHPIFHHTLIPNLQSISLKWGPLQYLLTTDSLGFKNQTTKSIPLSSQNFRILFMGDSFTAGDGLSYEKTFVGLINQKVSSQGIEILNGAVSSYSPAIYYLKTQYLLKNVGLKFNHLIVCLDISDIQDEAEYYEIVDGKIVYQKYHLKEWVFDYTLLTRKILRKSLKILKLDPELQRTKNEESLGINLFRSLWTINEAAFKQYGEIGLTKAKIHMNQLHQLLKEAEIPLTLVIYPWPDQIFNNDLDSRQVQFWKEWAESQGVPIINLFPDFISPANDPKHVISQNFIPGDVHWNENGHRLVANQLMKKLPIVRNFKFESLNNNGIHLDENLDDSNDPKMPPNP